MAMKKYLKYVATSFLIIFVLLASGIYYIHQDLKNQEYGMIYVLGSGDFQYETQKYPKFIYNAYLNFFRDNKEAYMKIEPSPIIWAMSTDEPNHKKIEMIEKMLKSGVSIDAISKDTFSHTPIFASIIFSDITLFNHLIKKGANINVKDYKKRTPLEFAEMILQKKQESSNIPEEIESLKKMIQYMTNSEKERM